jgi:hypothetical protein
MVMLMDGTIESCLFMAAAENVPGVKQVIILSTVNTLYDAYFEERPPSSPDIEVFPVSLTRVQCCSENLEPIIDGRETLQLEGSVN